MAESSAGSEQRKGEKMMKKNKKFCANCFKNSIGHTKAVASIAN